MENFKGSFSLWRKPLDRPLKNKGDELAFNKIGYYLSKKKKNKNKGDELV
jgi:hypothetical protein